MFCFINVNIGDFLNRLKASEGDDSVVNSVGDVLEQQVSEKPEMEFVSVDMADR